MRQNNTIRNCCILIFVSMIFGHKSSFCQEVKSNFVKFKVNNIGDTESPRIKILTPSLSQDLHYKTDVKEIVLIGEVTDSDGIRFISVNDDVRSINETGIFTSRLTLKSGENIIHVIAADNKDNLIEQFITISYIPGVVSLSEKIAESSKYYSLIIGIDKYQDPNLPDLDNPINDAEKLYNALISKYSFEDDNVMILRNAKRIDIVNALDNLAITVTPDDNLLIFYAGHGNWDERANVGYWLPSDAS